MKLRRIGAFAACLLCASVALAQPAANDPRTRAGFERHLGGTLPASLAFRDESGARVELSDYYGSAPIVLVFAWYGCTSLCPTVIESLARALERGGTTPGQDYQVIVASIDPLDSPAAAMRMKEAHLAGATTRDEARAWHLLTGTEGSTATLAEAAGFRYGYDTDTRQYAHPTGILLVTPQGRIARYFGGFDFTAPELRGALHDAAARRIASPADFVRLLCFHVSSAGRYSAGILQALRIVTLGSLAVAIVALLRARRRRAVAQPD